MKLCRYSLSAALRRSQLTLVVVPLALGACASETSPQVAITVAALELPGVVDACYGLTITNGDGQVVESLDGICASRFGENNGITYIAPCDAATGNNTVTLVLESLSDDDDEIDVDSYRNPCGDPQGDNFDGFGPCVRSFPCVENQDTLVMFDITVMRSARQGFFDIAVDFEDVFCSAKADCTDDLLNAPGGDRVPTVVLGFACAAGVGEATALYQSALTLSCEGQAPIVLSLSGADGNQFSLLDPAPSPLVQVGIYRDAEELVEPLTQVSIGMLFQNVALGFDLSGVGRNCQLTLSGTASASGTIQDCTTPVASVYPVINWSFDVTNAAGTAFACGAHGLDEGSEVATGYTGFTTTTSFATMVTAQGTEAVAEACPEPTGGVGAIEGKVYTEARYISSTFVAGQPIYRDGMPGQCFDGQDYVPCFQLAGYQAGFDDLWFDDEYYSAAGWEPQIAITGDGGFTASVTLAAGDPDFRFDGLPTDQTYCVRWMNSVPEPWSAGMRWPVEPPIALFEAPPGNASADWPGPTVERCGLTVTANATTAQDFGIAYSDGGFTLEFIGTLSGFFYWEGAYGGDIRDPVWMGGAETSHDQGYQDSTLGPIETGCFLPVTGPGTCDVLIGDDLHGYPIEVQQMYLEVRVDDGGTPGALVADSATEGTGWVSPTEYGGATYEFYDFAPGTYCVSWLNTPVTQAGGNPDGLATEFLWNPAIGLASYWPAEPWVQSVAPDAGIQEPWGFGRHLTRCGVVVESGQTTVAPFGFFWND